jgi:hypothetical protein
MKRLQLNKIFVKSFMLGGLLLISSASQASAPKGLGAFSPSNYKTQYVYEDKVIAGDRLQLLLHKRKAEFDSCAAVLNGEQAAYGSYYKVPGGNVAIELTLDQSGKVSPLRIAKDTLPDPKVADCLQRQLKSMQVDVSGLKDFQLKKFLVIDINCRSDKAGDSTVSNRCQGSSQLYDSITIQ